MQKETCRSLLRIHNGYSYKLPDNDNSPIFAPHRNASVDWITKQINIDEKIPVCALTCGFNQNVLLFIGRYFADSTDFVICGGQTTTLSMRKLLMPMARYKNEAIFSCLPGKTRTASRSSARFHPSLPRFSCVLRVADYCCHFTVRPPIVVHCATSTCKH